MLLVHYPISLLSGLCRLRHQFGPGQKVKYASWGHLALRVWNIFAYNKQYSTKTDTYILTIPKIVALRRFVLFPTITILSICKGCRRIQLAWNRTLYRKRWLQFDRFSFLIWEDSTQQCKFPDFIRRRDETDLWMIYEELSWRTVNCNTWWRALKDITNAILKYSKHFFWWEHKCIFQRSILFMK